MLTRLFVVLMGFMFVAYAIMSLVFMFAFGVPTTKPITDTLDRQECYMLYTEDSCEVICEPLIT